MSLDKSQRFRILLIRGDSADADRIAAALSGAKEPAFSVEWVAELSAAFLLLDTEEQRDAVVLDLFLRDCAGLATFQRLRRAVSDMPILILCDPSQESLGIFAVEGGAQDYLLNTHLDSFSLRWTPQRNAAPYGS
jgi:DNA-binding response OmpR family regulator